MVFKWQKLFNLIEGKKILIITMIKYDSKHSTHKKRQETLLDDVPLKLHLVLTDFLVPLKVSLWKFEGFSFQYSTRL